jgi:biopolymer transport protein ExbD
MGMTVGGKGSMSEPNIVPLIDVLLVLLIIFMVISPVTLQGLNARLPQPSPRAENPDPAQAIVVTSGGTVLINQDRVAWDDLGSRLNDIFKQRAERVAFVKGDDSVEFVQVARAVDILRGAGIDNVGLVTANIPASEK